MRSVFEHSVFIHSVGIQRAVALGLLIVIVALAVWIFKPKRDSNEPSAASSAVSASRPITSSTTQASKLSEVGPVESDHPLDPVLAMAREALLHMQQDVADYRGKLIKRERISGILGAEVQMEFKIRTRREASANEPARPLAAYLKFLEPWSARGREVIWIEGENDNKLIGHEGGFKNLLRVELEPTGMLAMLDNKYPITEIGLTKLVEKLIEKGERDREVGPCEVQIIEGQTVGDRECRLIQVTHPEPDKRFDFHIAQIFIDTERMIPLRYAAFLWAEEEGAEPPLEEEYTYLNVELNVGLTDKDFDPENPAYKYP